MTRAALSQVDNTWLRTMDNSFETNRKKRRVAYYGDQAQYSRPEGLPGGVTTEAQGKRHSPFPRQGYSGHHGTRYQYVCNSSSLPPQAPPLHRHGAMEDSLWRVSSYHSRPIPPPPPPPRPPPIPSGPSSNSYRKGTCQDMTVGSTYMDPCDAIITLSVA